MPDTGATVSLLAYRIAQQQNLFVNKLKKPLLVNASGLPMLVEGMAKGTLCALQSTELFEEKIKVVDTE